jgi:hypothetical protein
MRRLFLIVVTSLLIAPVSSRGQTQPSAARQTLRATRVEQPVRLDGVLDDAVWTNAQVGTDFIQRYPTPGLLATLRTEVRVAYDNDAIYVAARMFDPHPDSIAAPLSRRDPGSISSDWIDVIFDSYHDRRTAYRFGLNPAGTKLDVYHFNDDDQDQSWDAIWDAATKIDSLGWTAEIRVPLSQLRFHGSAGEQTWGLQFYRAVARRDEWSHWVAYAPSAPGFVSTFGELTGLVGLRPPSPVEVTPYLSTRVASDNSTVAGPLGKPRALDGTLGADFRLGLGSALSVTGAVNPDFGQVEVDPAVINLSAVETFFPEKRPFFLEGSGIFEFGRMPVHTPYGFSRFVHWRRIGRSPQLSTGAEWSRSPDQTTILGAAKISGQIGGGWSLGVTDAVTQREEAEIIDVDGNRTRATVEPLTNYFVGRAQRDFAGGRSSVGVLATGVNRSLDEGQSSLLRESAWLLGVDGKRSTRDRRWTVGGHLIGSRVAGTPAAIASTQRSSARYFQRVDADHLAFDPSLTSLTGYDAAASLIYIGNPFYGSAQIAQTTPGYESNDLGFMSRGDLRSAVAAVGRRWNGLSGFVRDGRVTMHGMHARNFGGDALYHRLGVEGSATLQSLWFLTGSAALKPAVFSDHRTRGGPLLRVPLEWEVEGSISTDGRKSIVGSFEVAYEDWTRAGFEASYSATATLRPSPSLQLSVSPGIDVVRNEAQYVRTVPDALAPAFANRYVFASLKQRTLSVDVRSDWTLTPTLSLQLFAQPFQSSARFSDYKELRSPGTFNFNVYGRDVGTAGKSDDGSTTVDPDGAGPASAFVLGTRSNESSFLARALRMNAVLRWEYRGGSTVYLVWQQTRDGDSALLPGTPEGIHRILEEPSRNVIHLKASYRIGR